MRLLLPPPSWCMEGCNDKDTALLTDSNALSYPPSLCMCMPARVFAFLSCRAVHIADESLVPRSFGGNESNGRTLELWVVPGSVCWAPSASYTLLLRFMFTRSWFRAQPVVWAAHVTDSTFPLLGLPPYLGLCHVHRDSV
jgi:hypothetical protein